MNGWSLAKYLLALLGLALVVLSDQLARPWVGYVGLGLLIGAFLLRFVRRSRLKEPERTPWSRRPGT